MKGNFIKSNQMRNYSHWRRIAFVHHKGGTGKTTACLNIAGWLTKFEQKVLVIDLDPQANATTGLGIDLKTVELSMYDVLLKQVPLNEIILETQSKIYVAPASTNLLFCETKLSGHLDAVTLLDKKMHGLSNTYDYILIDSPPGSTVLMLSSMVATRNIIIPLDAGVFGFETLATLRTLILDLEKKLNITINIINGVMKIFSASIFDMKLTSEIHKMVNDFFTSTGLQNCPLYTVPFSKKVCQAQMQGVPISHYAPKSAVSKVYQQIAVNILSEGSIK